jgi:hypothetical protein
VVPGDLLDDDERREQADHPDRHPGQQAAQELRAQHPPLRQVVVVGPMPDRGGEGGQDRPDRHDRQGRTDREDAEQAQLADPAQLLLPATGRRRHGGRHPLIPLVLMPSTMSRWNTRKNRNTGTSESTDIANMGPTAFCPLESRNSRNPIGTV